MIWKLRKYSKLFRNIDCRTRKRQKYEIRFTRKITRSERNFQVLIVQVARIDIISNVHHFCKPKSSCFLRETAAAVKRIPFFVPFSMFWVVYWIFIFKRLLYCTFKNFYRFVWNLTHMDDCITIRFQVPETHSKCWYTVLTQLERRRAIEPMRFSLVVLIEWTHYTRSYGIIAALLHNSCRGWSYYLGRSEEIAQNEVVW